MPFELVSWPGFAVAVAIALVLAVVIAAVVAVPVRLVARRRGWDARDVGRVRRPFRVLLVVIGVWAAIDAAFPLRSWVEEAGSGPRTWATLPHLLLVLVIAATAWLAFGVVSFALGGVLARHPTDVADNRVARRVRTQVLIVRRIAGVALVVVAAGAILLTFPGVEAVGTSVLASAGLLSVVAGLAAQSTLSNVFAGMQLAFSDAIRIDDVVVVEQEWGTIEEITLTYVVVHLWDDRRLVLPSTWFTSTPFQNWTRSSSELLGAVELDVDWGVSPAGMREELDRILDGTELWDRRVKVLQVTDAVGGLVRVRVLVTAVDAPTLFDLRCLVRERLVEWSVRSHPGGLPRQRVELVEAATAPRRAAPREPAADTGGLFTGSADAEERAQNLTTAIPVVGGSSRGGEVRAARGELPGGQLDEG